MAVLEIYTYIPVSKYKNDLRVFFRRGLMLDLFLAI